MDKNRKGKNEKTKRKEKKEKKRIEDVGAHFLLQVLITYATITTLNPRIP